MKPLKPSTPLLLLAVLVLASGCAGRQRDVYMQDKAAAHVYPLPINQVWPQARAVLAERGFSFRESPQEYEAVTEWLQTTNTASSLGITYERYLLRGHPVGRDRSSVEFIKMTITETYVTKTEARRGAQQLAPDHVMAWKLLERVDAAAAQQYAAEASQKFPE
jgi:uncharacterized lipoprotein